MSESDVYRRQILTSKVDPRAVRINVRINVVEPTFLSARGILSLKKRILFNIHRVVVRNHL